MCAHTYDLKICTEIYRFIKYKHKDLYAYKFAMKFSYARAVCYKLLCAFTINYIKQKTQH